MLIVYNNSLDFDKLMTLDARQLTTDDITIY